jgi:hypothetical protein
MLKMRESDLQTGKGTLFRGGVMKGSEAEGS